MKTLTTKLLATVGLGTALMLGGCEMPPPESTQWGYRGTGMEGVYNPDRLDELAASNIVPEAIPAVPAVGPKAKDIYQNVEVLGDLSVGEFTRLMAAITQWVSPEEGCNYCHVAGEGFAADTLYTKKIARVMLQITQNAHDNWAQHVGVAGVTYYPCLRGPNVPESVWNINPGPQGGGWLLSFWVKTNGVGKRVKCSISSFQKMICPFYSSEQAPTGERCSVIRW